MGEKRGPYKKREKELTSGEKLIKKARERYKRGRDAQSTEDNCFRDDVRFCYDEAYQWPSEIRRQREIDGRPCISVNRMPQFVRQITNDYRQNTPAISVRPVDDHADKEVAEIYSGIIRHIESQSNAEACKENALDNSVAGGKGFYRIVTEYIPGTFTQDIFIKPIQNTLAVTYDCDDTSMDGSGWRWCFVEDEISKEEFESRFPDVDMLGWESSTSNWVQDKGEKIKIAEYFYKETEKATLCLLDDGSVVWESELQEGMNVVDTRESEKDVVRWCFLGGDAKEPLEEREWAGAYIPVIPIWGDVKWVNGKRELISLIRYAKDSQRMLNFWRSSETELLSLQNKAPFVLTNTQVEGHEQEWAGANATNLPYITYNSDPSAARPQREGFAGAPTGVLAAAQNVAQDMMDTIGIQKAGLGQPSNEQSGRAIIARQREGDTSTYHFIDNAARADRYCGVILVDLIPKIYDTPAIVRTLGLDGTEKMVSINQPSKEKGEYGEAIDKFYDLNVGRYDVVVNSGPSYNTRRQESVEAMSQILQGNPQLMGIAGDLFIKAMDWPGSEEIAERIKKTLPPNLVPPEDEENPMPPEVRMQLEQMNAQMEEMNQVIMQQQQALDDKSAELQIKQFDAETKRLQVMTANQPQPTVEVENPELSDADKYELEIERERMNKKIDHENAKDMATHQARLNKLNAEGDELVDGLTLEGEEKPSQLALAMQSLMEGQAQLTQTLGVQSQQLANLTAITAAPKALSVARGPKGELIGGTVEPVLN